MVLLLALVRAILGPAICQVLRAGAGIGTHGHLLLEAGARCIGLTARREIAVWTEPTALV